MKKTFKRIRIMLALLVAAVAASAYLLLYRPLYGAFRNLTLDNFLLSATAVSDGANGYVERCKEGAASLSSRTMIKKAILAYRRGEMSFENLEAFTLDPYREGVTVLSELIGVVRVVDGRVLVREGAPFAVKPETTFGVQGLELRFDFAEGGNPLGDPEALTVVSPIFEGTLILGYDVARFELGGLGGAGGEKCCMSLAIIPGGEAAALRAGTEEPFRSKSDSLVGWNGNLGLLKGIPESGAFILAYLPARELFSNGASFAAMNLLRFLLLLLVLLGGSNLFIMVSLRGILTGMELRGDAYREYAIHDPLTGLLTRRFLELWVESEVENLSEGYALAMVDLDRFKVINDTLGHDAGDEALTLLAKLLQGAVRSGDFAVRQGGDEFLLWVRGAGEELAKSVLERLETRLQEEPFRGVPLEISWGICAVPRSDSNSRAAFTKALQTADSRMYAMKNAKKKAPAEPFFKDRFDRSPALSPSEP